MLNIYCRERGERSGRGKGERRERERGRLGKQSMCKIMPSVHEIRVKISDTGQSLWRAQ